MEHFNETLNQPPPSVAPYDFTTFNPPEDLTVNLDTITTGETEKAIRMLKKNKAAGLDQITAELLKHGVCWRKERVLEQWRKGVIAKLPKKGSVTDCNN